MKWKASFYVKRDISDVGDFYDIVTQKKEHCIKQQTLEFTVTISKFSWTVLLQTFIF